MSEPTLESARPTAGFPPEDETIDRLKGLFLASLNHEIRTPLSGILGMTDLLLETPLSAEQQEYVTTTRACAENLFEILNATLEYAALSSGRLLLEDSEYSLAEVLDAAVASHAGKARAKGLKLVATLDPRLPETLSGDAQRLREILGHLLANAVKFTVAGQIEVRAMWAETAAGLHRLELSVSDTGIGIDAQKLAGIFDSFRQLDTGLSRTYSGLGLGLALVQKLASFMGGEIRVESRPGVGSTFTVSLPLRRAEETRHAAPPPVATPAASHRLLVVEDNDVGQQIIRHMLSRQPYQVDFAATGKSAIEAAGSHRYDLILMDLQVPDMDGFAITDAIRKIHGYEQTPVLALTANTADEYRKLCLERGLQAFLSKPIHAAELHAAVGRYLK